MEQNKEENLGIRLFEALPFLSHVKGVCNIGSGV